MRLEPKWRWQEVDFGVADAVDEGLGISHPEHEEVGTSNRRIGRIGQ
jgi:hypothetical protein